MTKPMRIFVSGPYGFDDTLDTEARRGNAVNATVLAVQLLWRGHYPFVPHLYHLAAVTAAEAGLQIHETTFVSAGISFLKQCDAILYYLSSPGADRELEVAEQIGLDVFKDINEVPFVE